MIHPAGRSDTGAPVRNVQLSQAIDISDLDLTTVTGRSDLQRRIDLKAQDLCDQLWARKPMEDGLTYEYQCASTGAAGYR
jgi:UrcA family protein